MVEFINNNLTAFWFALGFLLLTIEILAFGLGSGVLLFGSVGALATGALMWFGLLTPSWVAGIAAFAVASAIATALLWYPLKKMQQGPELGNDRSSDLIGHSFRLDTDITRVSSGKTRYSGVDWRVEISEESARESLDAGSRVGVVAVNAGIFYVEPL